MKTRYHTDQLARVLKALGDETRLRVVASLSGGERCVCEIEEELDIAQSLLSFHLKTLKEAGVLSDRREGRWVFYALNREVLREAGDFLTDAVSSESRLPIHPARCR